MKRLSLWVAAISFGAMGVPASSSGPPQPASDVHKRVIAPPGPKPVGPYSPGIMAGDFLYVSGQGARDRDGRLPETVEAQVRQTLENVKGDRRGRRVDAGARRLQPGIPRQHVELRHDGPCLARILSETAAGTSRPRCSPDAHRHSGRDQCRRLPRSLPQEAHRPCRLSAELASDCRRDGRRPALPVRIVWRRRRERQRARGSGRAGATRAGQHETDA